MYKALVTIARFDIVDTSGFVPQLFDLNAEEEAYSIEFERLMYEQQNFLVNSGFIAIMICVILGLVVVSIIF